MKKLAMLVRAGREAYKVHAVGGLSRFGRLTIPPDARLSEGDRVVIFRAVGSGSARLADGDLVVRKVEVEEVLDGSKKP